MRNRIGQGLPLLAVIRRVWPLLAGLGLIPQVVALGAGLVGIYTDFQVLNAFRAISSSLSYEAFAMGVLAWRGLAALLFWMTGAFLYYHAGRRQGETGWLALFTALLLVLLPQLLFLNDNRTAAALPAPWQGFFTSTSQLVTLLALVMLVLFYFFFPSGRPTPGWLRWVALSFAFILLMLFAVLASAGSETEWLWLAGMGALLLALLSGAAYQVYRYHQQASPDDRRQTKGIVIVLAGLPAFLVAVSLLGSSAPGALAALLLASLAPAALPLAFLAAFLRGQLWGLRIPAPQARRAMILAGVLALAWIGGLALAKWVETRRLANSLVLEPLPQSLRPRHVIIDTDMAPDDWMAILYLLQRPDIRVLAITVAGTGETHCLPGVRNALGLVALAGRSEIPVACGRETPLQGAAAFPDAWRERADRLNGLSLPDGQNPVAPIPAAALLRDTILQSPEKVTLLALGPLTNLAEAIRSEAGFLGQVEQVYVMGGALEVLGNVGFSGVGIDNQVAEWNIYVDPLAAQEVLASGVPVTFVPLDATNGAPVTLAFYRQLQAHRRTPEAEFVFELLSSQLASIASSTYSFWDPLAAAVLVDESLVFIKEGNVKIFTQAGSSSGLTRVMANGTPARYAKSVDRVRFEVDFLRTLNQP